VKGIMDLHLGMVRYKSGSHLLMDSPIRQELLDLTQARNRDGSEAQDGRLSSVPSSI
jgi:hypothetical protein